MPLQLKQTVMFSLDKFKLLPLGEERHLSFLCESQSEEPPGAGFQLPASSCTFSWLAPASPDQMRQGAQHFATSKAPASVWASRLLKA